MVGVIKEFDKLGRIVIPKELRDRYLDGEKMNSLKEWQLILIIFEARN